MRIQMKQALRKALVPNMTLADYRHRRFASKDSLFELSHLSGLNDFRIEALCLSLESVGNSVVAYNFGHNFDDGIKIRLLFKDEGTLAWASGIINRYIEDLALVDKEESLLGGLIVRGDHEAGHKRQTLIDKSAYPDLIKYTFPYGVDLPDQFDAEPLALNLSIEYGSAATNYADVALARDKIEYDAQAGWLLSDSSIRFRDCEVATHCKLLIDQLASWEYFEK